MAFKYLSMIATHLNVSSAVKIAPEQIAKAFKTAKIEASSPLVYSLFTEADGSTLVMAAKESGATIEQANNLYKSTIAAGAPKSLAWEQAIAHLT